MYDGKCSVTHLVTEVGVGSGEQAAVDSSATSPIAAKNSRRLIRLSRLGVMDSVGEKRDQTRVVPGQAEGAWQAVPSAEPERLW